MTEHVVKVALLALPLYMLMVGIGKACVGFVPETVFKKVVLGLVMAGAVSALVA